MCYTRPKVFSRTRKRAAYHCINRRSIQGLKCIRKRVKFLLQGRGGDRIIILHEVQVINQERKKVEQNRIGREFHSEECQQEMIGEFYNYLKQLHELGTSRLKSCFVHFSYSIPQLRPSSTIIGCFFPTLSEKL